MNDTDKIKDKAISFGWIVGILFFLSLLWVLSQNAQKQYLLKTVNNMLFENGDSRRVMAYKGVNDGRTGMFGYWYLIYDSTIDAKEKMFVFAAFQDGILVPLGAIVSANDSVVDIVPLSAHAKQVMDKIPAGVLQLYVTRIEAAALAIKKGYK